MGLDIYEFGDLFAFATKNVIWVTMATPSFRTVISLLRTSGGVTYLQELDTNNNYIVPFEFAPQRILQPCKALSHNGATIRSNSADVCRLKTTTPDIAQQTNEPSSIPLPAQTGVIHW